MYVQQYFPLRQFVMREIPLASLMQHSVTGNILKSYSFESRHWDYIIIIKLLRQFCQHLKPPSVFLFIVVFVSYKKVFHRFFPMV